MTSYAPPEMTTHYSTKSQSDYRPSVYRKDSSLTTSASTTYLHESYKVDSRYHFELSERKNKIELT